LTKNPPHIIIFLTIGYKQKGGKYILMKRAAWLTDKGKEKLKELKEGGI